MIAVFVQCLAKKKILTLESALQIKSVILQEFHDEIQDSTFYIEQ